MCGRSLDSDPCVNFKCPHNLFWEELSLDRNKIQMTDKALEIRNCCRRIIDPWTREEISDAWGLTKEVIRRSEEEALKNLQRKVRINLEKNSDINHKKYRSWRNFKFEEIRKPKYGIYSLQNSCGR